jgi:tripartite-type tricarboxylate transporter receptor subunit TctC
MTTRRATLAGISAALLPLPVRAQAFPSRPVRLVVAFPAGASTDIVARILGQKLAEALGQSFVVENRPGAGGNIATGLVKGEKADGHTLLAHSVAFAVNPSLYRNARYDPVKDFAAVALGGATPNVLFVHPDFPAKTLAELLERARKGDLNYASSGNGTTTHLGAELLFRTLAKVNVTHVPYTPPQAVTAVVGNNVPIGSTSLPPPLQFIKAGRLRALAVTGAKRAPELPDVPTVAEQGFPGFEANTWFAFLAPAGTPADVVAKLNAAFNKALGEDDVKAKFAAAGLGIAPMAPAPLAAFVAAEAEKWAKVVKDAGATAD